MDFVGFRFGSIHTRDLQLLVTSSGDRYNKNLLPEPKDYTVEVPGGNGNYYFGSTFQSRVFVCEVAFDRIDEKTWRRISDFFSTDKLQDLVFDELPYKTYKAKLKSQPEFTFVCFTDRKTGERVYKGEGTLTFVCYFPFAFGFNKYIVKNADFYKTYEEDNQEPFYKQYFNTEYNYGYRWHGGYPTKEQAKKGELFKEVEEV